MGTLEYQCFRCFVHGVCSYGSITALYMFYNTWDDRAPCGAPAKIALHSKIPSVSTLECIFGGDVIREL